VSALWQATTTTVAARTSEWQDCTMGSCSSEGVNHHGTDDRC
jgi:hypothetical protein